MPFAQPRGELGESFHDQTDFRFIRRSEPAHEFGIVELGSAVDRKVGGQRGGRAAEPRVKNAEQTVSVHDRLNPFENSRTADFESA